MKQNTVTRAVSSATQPVRDASAAVGNAVRPVTDGVKQVGSNVSNTLNRAWLFIDGSIKGMLNFTARFGRKGLFIGAIAGAIGMLAPTGVVVAGLGKLVSLELPLFGALGGAMAGSVLGAAAGLLTGGLKRLELEDRKEKYAGQLDENRRAQRGVGTRRKGGPNTAFARASEQLDRINADRSLNHLDRLDNERQQRSGDADRSFRDQVEEARQADLAQGLNH